MQLAHRLGKDEYAPSSVPHTCTAPDRLIPREVRHTLNAPNFLPLHLNFCNMNTPADIIHPRKTAAQTPWYCLAFLIVALFKNGVTRASADQPPQVGAEVPFVTIEAEARSNRTNGRIVQLAGLPKATDFSPQLEASGRAFVELTDVGQFVEFQAPSVANAMVVRHCIPDAPSGGGITAMLGLYINGRRAESITLSSRHNWLYGSGEIGSNGQSDTPNEHPHVFWDEVRFFLPTPIAAGDTVRLQKDAADTAAFYRIDLMEPELVPPPLTPPTGALSVLDFGATPDDETVDTAAIARCIAAARERKVPVWLPPGTFLQDERFDLDGATVRGAGMWHTRLQAVPKESPRSFGRHLGFRPSGVGSAVSDLTIEGCQTDRSGGQIAFVGIGTGWKIENVWMTHLSVGAWMAGEDASFVNCRVRMTYADGININNGKTLTARRILVENNHVRGTGDDGIAILAHNQSPHVTARITVRRNTVIAPWWAHCFDLAGGRDHLIEENFFADSTQHGGLVINLPGAFPMYPQQKATIRKNVVLRCGGNFARQRRGAIWIFPGSTRIDDVTFSDNVIQDSLFRAIHVSGKHPAHITFERNSIRNVGQDGIVINGGASGVIVLTDNQLTGLPTQGKALVNDSKGECEVVAKGNTTRPRP